MSLSTDKISDIDTETDLKHPVEINRHDVHAKIWNVLGNAGGATGEFLGKTTVLGTAALGKTIYGIGKGFAKGIKHVITAA